VTANNHVREFQIDGVAMNPPKLVKLGMGVKNDQNTKAAGGRFILNGHAVMPIPTMTAAGIG
jgi:hypothetical protein